LDASSLALRPCKRSEQHHAHDDAAADAAHSLSSFLLLAFVKALHNRRSPWYQRGLIRKPLRKIAVILLHDIEHCFLGKPAMVLGINLCMAASCSSAMGIALAAMP
jgi:hypothetical protein